MKKVIYIIETDSKYFINNRIELAKTLLTFGYKVYVSTFSYSIHDIRRIEDENLVFIKQLDSKTNTVTYVLNSINRLNPDLVHIFTISAIAKVGMIAILMKKTKFIYSLTGLGFSFISNSAKARIIRLSLHVIFPLLTIRSNTKFIVQNNEDYSLISSRFLFGDKYLRLVIGSGVDIDKFTPTQRGNTTPNVLFAARLLIDKGIHELLKAIDELKRNRIKANFIIVGEIDENNPSSISKDDFVLLILNNKNIEYKGYINNMSQFLKDIDLVCLPSYREGLSKFLLESAASGLPIVTTDVPGCREIVDQGYNGFIVKPRDSSELTKKLTDLINNKDLRIQMGINSRNKVIKEFSLKKIIDQFLEIYEE